MCKRHASPEATLNNASGVCAGKPRVGYARFPIASIPAAGTVNVSLPLTIDPEGTQPADGGTLRLRISYRNFVDVVSESDSADGLSSADSAASSATIIDMQSAAAASSRATVEATAGLAALAVAKAAAARAAARATRAAYSVMNREPSVEDTAAKEVVRRPLRAVILSEDIV